MTNPSIPPCPVCGTVPELINEFCDVEVRCEHINDIDRHMDLAEWATICDELLGEAVRESGIHTLSELDEIINCAKDKYYFDVIQARNHWSNEHAKLATENAQLKAELESRLAPEPRVAVCDELGITDARMVRVYNEAYHTLQAHSQLAIYRIEAKVGN